MRKLVSILGVFLLAIGLLAGCGGQTAQEPKKDEQQAPAQEQKQEAAPELEGQVLIDGSSTVYPITEAVAEEFMKKYPKVNVTVGVSGTGGGFKKWVNGETDINDASRPIKDKEIEAAKANGIEVAAEVPVAFDGITVVVNKDNDFVDQLTVEELKKIWAPDSKVKKWSDVRQGWPAEEIKLYGPGTDSGTFGYFTEAINGEEGKSRSDYTASEDDNVLVQGVAGDKYALGYFGYAYYVENKDKLKAVPIVNKEGKAVEPTDQTINDGSYNPLSRKIFIYPSNKAMERPEVKEFVKFYLTEGRKFVSEVGYIELPDNMYQESLDKLGLK